MKQAWFKAKNYYTEEDGWYHPSKGFVSMSSLKYVSLETLTEIIEDTKIKETKEKLNETHF